MRGLECAPVWAPAKVPAELALVLPNHAYLSSLQTDLVSLRLEGNAVLTSYVLQALRRSAMFHSTILAAALARAEVAAIANAMKVAGGNRKDAARIVGIRVSTLHRKLGQLRDGRLDSQI